MSEPLILTVVLSPFRFASVAKPTKPSWRSSSLNRDPPWPTEGHNGKLPMDVTVWVTVLKIEIDSSENLQESWCRLYCIPAEIIEGQTLNVDAVSELRDFKWCFRGVGACSQTSREHKSRCFTEGSKAPSVLDKEDKTWFSNNGGGISCSGQSYKLVIIVVGKFCTEEILFTAGGSNECTRSSMARDLRSSSRWGNTLQELIATDESTIDPYLEDFEPESVVERSICRNPELCSILLLSHRIQTYIVVEKIYKGMKFMAND